LIGSSLEGTFNGQPIYNTKNYRLSKLAEFFIGYDFNAGLSLTTIEGLVNQNIVDIAALESSVSTINTSLTSLTSRVSTAEVKITQNFNGILSVQNQITSGLLKAPYWDTAYSESITGITVTENADGSQKTITLNRRGAPSLSSSFTDIFESGAGGITDTNNYVNSASFDVGTGVLTLGRLGLTNLTASFDGRYSLLGHTHTTTDITNLASYTGFDSRYVDIVGDTMTGQLTVQDEIDCGSVVFTAISAVADATNVNTFMPQANSVGVYSHSTGSTNWESEFGVSLVVRGSNNGRTFALERANNGTALNFGYFDGATWSWNEIAYAADFGSYLPLSGGTMTGTLNINSSTGISSIASSGTGISSTVVNGQWSFLGNTNGANNSGIQFGATGNPSLFLRDASGVLRTQINSSTTSSLAYGLNVSGVLTCFGNDIGIEGASPRLQLTETGIADWYFIADGETLSIRQTDLNTQRLSIDASGDLWAGSPASGRIIWHAGNDGPGTGLDADTLDGVQGDNFLRSNIADIATGNITFQAQVYIDNSDTLPVLTFRDASTDRLLFTSSTNQLRFRYDGTNDGIVVHTAASANFGSNSLTAQNFILSSDRRLKSDIKDLIPRDGVRWREFILNGDFRYGVIAQEVEDIYPEFVHTDDEGIKSVSYTDILVAENARLNSRVDELEKNIEVIKQMLSK
jgi:hypothetical protein